MILGAAGVGKTSIILRYCDNIFRDNYAATIGLDFKIRTIKVDDKVVKIQIWDTAGQEKYQSLSSMYYKGSHGCIAVYDITNPDSYDSAKKHLYKAYTDYGFEKGCAILVGNKLDIEEDRKVDRSEGISLAEAFNAAYIECSAKTAHSVDEVFYNLCQILVKKCENGAFKDTKPR